MLPEFSVPGQLDGIAVDNAGRHVDGEEPGIANRLALVKLHVRIEPRESAIQIRLDLPRDLLEHRLHALRRFGGRDHHAAADFGRWARLCMDYSAKHDRRDDDGTDPHSARQNTARLIAPP